jgi:hypothetical protein
MRGEDDGILYRALMIAVADAYNEERYAEAEALAQLACSAWPDDPLARELLEDSRRVRHRGGSSPYRDNIRTKHAAVRASLLDADASLATAEPTAH